VYGGQESAPRHDWRLTTMSLHTISVQDLLNMKNAFIFYAELMFAALIFHFLWRKLVLPIDEILLARREAVHSPSKSMVLINFLWFLCSTYFLIGWSSLGIQFVRIHANNPSVSHHWVYWLGGIALCTAPVSEISGKSATINFWIVFASFLVFAFWSVAMAPWQWCTVPILRLVGVLPSA
jgi:hypothetical protein